MHLEPSSTAKFTQILEKKIILLLRKQIGFQDAIMLCYAMFDLLPTHWSLLMEEIALVGFGVLAALLLNALVAWLMVMLWLIALLPTYLLGLLPPAIGKLALRLPNEFVHSNWSAPAFFNLEGSRFDLQIGAQATDYILPFPNEQVLENSLLSKSTLGGDAAVVAEPAANQRRAYATK